MLELSELTGGQSAAVAVGTLWTMLRLIKLLIPYLGSSSAVLDELKDINAGIRALCESHNGIHAKRINGTFKWHNDPTIEKQTTETHRNMQLMLNKVDKLLEDVNEGNRERNR